MGQKVYLLRGLPGSGKSMFIRKARLVERGYVVVSPDTERASFPLVRGPFGFAVLDQAKGRKAWVRAYAKMDAALAAGSDVVFDATLMSSKALKGVVKHIPDGVGFVIVDFKVDVATAEARNHKRWGTPGYVPTDVIRRMAKSGAHMNLSGYHVVSPDALYVG